MISQLLKKQKHNLNLYIKEKDIEDLKHLIKPKFARMTFHEAFENLYHETKDKKYIKPTIKNFGDYEEILITEIVGKPLFITNYIGDEVAFYHAPDPKNQKLVINADLLYPGYGEIIGSGERVHTRKETFKKVKHFQLNFDDYKAYINSRDLKNPKIHSGWGMGVERFIQCILRLPYIWEAKVFPRVDNSDKP